MIVLDLDLVGVAVMPTKASSPLVVDKDAVLPANSVETSVRVKKAI
jgi:hypothetical protein